MFPEYFGAADITYLPTAREGSLYLVVIYLAPIKDWHGRYVAAWRLSNTLEADFCVDAVNQTLGQGRPEV